MHDDNDKQSNSTLHGRSVRPMYRVRFLSRMCGCETLRLGVLALLQAQSLCMRGAPRAQAFCSPFPGSHVQEAAFLLWSFYSFIVSLDACEALCRECRFANCDHQSQGQPARWVGPFRSSKFLGLRVQLSSQLCQPSARQHSGVWTSLWAGRLEDLFCLFHLTNSHNFSQGILPRKS